jgi:hypothetical protein
MVVGRWAVAVVVKLLLLLKNKKWPVLVGGWVSQSGVGEHSIDHKFILGQHIQITEQTLR